MHFKTGFSVILLTLISLLALQLISASSLPMVDSPRTGERQKGVVSIILPTSIPSSGSSLVLATPTRLPENPATVHPVDLWFRMLEGAAVVLALFGLLGLYIGIRRVFRGY